MRRHAVLWGTLGALALLVVIGLLIPQRVDIVELGETQTLQVGRESADVTVDLERRGDELYLIHYSVNGDAPTVDRVWRLVDSDGTEHHASQVTGVDCAPGECTAVAVPAGTEITMVRYYGVDRPSFRYTSFGRVDWAGWTV